MSVTLEQLYEKQKELDARIIREKGLEGVDLLPNTVLALQVEIGELANEWRGFKHWSNDREPRTTYKCKKCSGKGYRSWFEGSFELGDLVERGEPCDECMGEGVDASVNPLLEEYVDCLHFFLSIARQLSVTYLPAYRPRIVEESTSEQILDLIMMIGEIRGWESDMTPEEKWEMAFYSFIDLGHKFGFKWDQIAAAYLDKNKTNHERQANGY
ncbi:dUTP diphosphatase [Paenibacillus sp. GCM10012303]|uniref:dUTP diphosphatase n=1 Tax=Paenibacillus sp. GCM10012303 TaxID=3317340 RepID=UPI00361B83C6